MAETLNHDGKSHLSLTLEMKKLFDNLPNSSLRNWELNTPLLVVRLSFNGGIEATNLVFECIELLDQKKRHKKVSNSLAWLIQDRLIHKFRKHLSRETPFELVSRLGYFCAKLIGNADLTCLICNSHLGIAMPCPTICNLDTCIFQFREMGYGISVETELLERPKVVELLITLLSCALLSRRDIDRSAIPSKIIEPAWNEKRGESMNFELTSHEETLFYALTTLPSIDTLVKYARENSLKTRLERLDKRLFWLIRYLIGSCRSYVRVANANEIQKDMHTPHQFVFDVDSAEKELRFQEFKSVYATEIAYHGSSSVAWSSILQQGLKNLSGTTDMSYGAQKGEGIYLSSSFHASSLYCKATRMPQPWLRSNLGLHPYAVSGCEVVKHPNVTTHQMEGGAYLINVVPGPDMVRLRYLYVYNESISSPMIAGNVKVPKHVSRTTELFRCPKVENMKPFEVYYTGNRSSSGNDIAREISLAIGHTRTKTKILKRKASEIQQRIKLIENHCAR